MADIVLGIGTSHSPVCVLPGEKWEAYAQNDYKSQSLVFPPDGVPLSYQEGLKAATDHIRNMPRGLEVYRKQADSIRRALDLLSDTLRAAEPDVTVIVSNDQAEWFFEDNMPAFSVYWGETAPIRPRRTRGDDPEIRDLVRKAYGDVEVDIPCATDLGKFAVEFLIDNEFDVSHFTYTNESYGGHVVQRAPAVPDSLRAHPPAATGLPHGFSFVVSRLCGGNPSAILPVFQNTCYPPNTPTAKRCYDFGTALAGAIQAWDSDARVAVIASGGLSHFVVDEELDRQILGALVEKNADALRKLPRHRMHSGTSESLNWVTVGGAMATTSLNMEVIEYVPGYRTEAGTGGGWAFARWQ